MQESEIMLDKPRPSAILDDAVDVQLDTYSKSLSGKKFKPAEGLTQGYVESQRIFARVATVVLAFSGAIDLELSNNTLSTDDNLLKLNKALETWTRPWRARDLIDACPEIEQLDAGSRIKDGKYSYSYDGYVTKSLIWSVATTARTFFVANFYGVATPAISSMADFVALAKSVVAKDYAVMRFNYGKYAPGSQQPRFGHGIEKADRQNGGVHGPMDKFARPRSQQQRQQQEQLNARPAAVQRVVDVMHVTQDTLSVILPRGQFRDAYSALGIASTYTSPAAAALGDGSLASVLHSLQVAAQNTALESRFNHNTPYDNKALFFNAPRNMRGICLFQVKSADNTDCVTEKSYTEDVASAAVGLAFLMQKSEMFGLVGNGTSLAQSVDWSSLTVDGTNIHLDAMVFISIVKDGGDGAQLNRVSANNGDPLLEDVLTNELLGCSLYVTLGMPPLPGDDPANLCFFAAFVLPQFATGGGDFDDIDTFFEKVLDYAMRAADVVDHMTAEDCGNVCIGELQYRVPLRVLHEHTPVADCITPLVITAGSERTDPRDTVAASIELGGGAELCQTAVRNVMTKFAAPLAEAETLI